jgi:hypothetical protein
VNELIKQIKQSKASTTRILLATKNYSLQAVMFESQVSEGNWLSAKYSSDRILALNILRPNISSKLITNRWKILQRYLQETT